MKADPQAYRYAVYYAPLPQDPWWAAGSAWLGRCATSRQALAQPPIPGLSPARQAELTQAPRRYGLHATLKAPFQLRAGLGAEHLLEQARELALGHRSFALPPLAVRRLGDFLALVPDAPCAALHTLADACVTQLHALAAPLPNSELERRRAGGLTPRQDELLLRWGYPLVLEQFQFHCSLTGRLQSCTHDEIAHIMAAAQEAFSHLPAPRLESLAIFMEPTPGADFELLEHVRLA